MWRNVRFEGEGVCVRTGIQCEEEGGGVWCGIQSEEEGIDV